MTKQTTIVVIGSLKVKIELKILTRMCDAQVKYKTSTYSAASGKVRPLKELERNSVYISMAVPLI